MNKSYLEQQFKQMWEHYYPDLLLTCEYRFTKRRWRFDFAHLGTKVAIEINGGRWVKSKHTSGVGILRDYEKNNCAITEGWVVFQLCDVLIDEQNLGIIAETILKRF